MEISQHTTQLAVAGYFLLSWLICLASGYGVALLVMPTTWQRDRVLLAPIVGAALLTLLAANASYLGASMHRAAPFILLAAMTTSVGGVALMRSRRRAAINWREAAGVHLLGLVAGGSALLSVLLYRAWNPYTDAFTYMSVADYVQSHSYFTPAIPDATHPLLTQMWLHQHYGFRMGSSFLLAFFSALYRAQYSFDLYLPVLALGLAMGVPGFWILCRRALFMSRQAAAVSAVLYGLNSAVPIANALWGFMPQTWGLAFMLPAIALYIQATQRRDRTKRIALAGFGVACVLLTYTEVVPFMVAAVGTCYLVRWVKGRLSFRATLIHGALPLLIAALVVPVAAWSFVTVIRTQYGAVVGWDVGLNFFDYVAMLTGFRSIVQSVVMTPGLAHTAWRLAALASFLTAVWAVGAIPRRTGGMIRALGAVFVVGLVWLAVCTFSPWKADQLGQPWTTYKLVTYGFFLFVALWGQGLVTLWQGVPWMRGAVVAELLALLAFFPVGAVETARAAAKGMQELTGSSDPIAEYKRLPELVADLPSDEPVNLVVPTDAQKHRQMVAYFLRRPIIADWSDDSYIGVHMPPGGNLAVNPLHPSLQYQYQPAASSIARMVVRRNLDVVIAQLTTGWYDREEDRQSWWRWLEERGDVDLLVTAAGRLTLHGEIAVVGPEPRTVSVSIDELPSAAREYSLTPRGFTPFETEQLQVPAGRYHLTIRADGPVAAMSSRDPRKIRIGMRNLTWTVEKD